MVEFIVFGSNTYATMLNSNIRHASYIGYNMLVGEVVAVSEDK
jgi:hypothetical protein